MHQNPKLPLKTLHPDLSGEILKDSRFPHETLPDSDHLSAGAAEKPTSVEIIDKADVLQKDKPVTLGTCVATDANPRAEITWTKNGQLMVADGKEDADAVFVCVSTHEMITEDAELEPFAIHYPSETVSLQIMSKKPVVEGDNVTLKCNADGNPPPSSYFFHLKGQKMLVENSDTYTLTSISREAAGEYKCTLPDNEKMEDTQNIVVSYLDLNLSLSGKVVKKVGEALSVQTEKSGSGDVKVSWTKNGKMVAEPQADKLSFADAGVYVCVASIPGVTRRKSFELVVEAGGSISKKVLSNASEHVDQRLIGSEPFKSGQLLLAEESSYVNNKATHKITVVPRVNLTVTCTVSNKLGEDVRTINVSSVFKEESEKKESQEDSDDQAKLIVGVVAGLLIAAAVCQYYTRGVLQRHYWHCRATIIREVCFNVIIGMTVPILYDSLIHYIVHVFARLLYGSRNIHRLRCDRALRVDLIFAVFHFWKSFTDASRRCSIFDRRDSDLSAVRSLNHRGKGKLQYIIAN
ncbi:CD166 antigen-like protein A [Larimichthys crocea]|uniref:Uncharacterized protein n=1 Tax=Larimichthys crocea TaxID=215358 RepID=A0ACD3R4T1_LARCR|nr:CD166 antigen-like protein A [Larimichthys crocea]